MIRTLALVALLGGFALGALSQLAQAPTLLPWSFGAAGAAIALIVADVLAARRSGRDSRPERGAFDPDPAVWESSAETAGTPDGRPTATRDATDRR
ncbi:MAG: hypothetical protein U1F64_17830 [Burkholderiales bacterium]